MPLGQRAPTAQDPPVAPRDSPRGTSTPPPPSATTSHPQTTPGKGPGGGASVNLSPDRPIGKSPGGFLTPKSRPKPKQPPDTLSKGYLEVRWGHLGKVFVARADELVAGTVLDEVLYPLIRKAVNGVGFTEVVLPDAILHDTIYVQAEVDRLLALFPVVECQTAAAVTRMLAEGSSHLGELSPDAVTSRSGMPPIVTDLLQQLPVESITVKKGKRSQAIYHVTPILVTLRDSDLELADEMGFVRVSTQPDPTLPLHSVVQFADDLCESAHGVEMSEILRFTGDITSVQQWRDSPVNDRPRNMGNSGLVRVTWDHLDKTTWEHRALPPALARVSKSQKLAVKAKTSSATPSKRKCMKKRPRTPC